MCRYVAVEILVVILAVTGLEKAINDCNLMQGRNGAGMGESSSTLWA